jgi:hypothetical protein
MTKAYTFPWLSFTLYMLGMGMVWHLTHNGWALFWTWVATIRVQATVRVK